MAATDHVIAFRASDEDLRLIEAVRVGRGLTTSSETIRHCLRVAATQLESGRQLGQTHTSALLQTTSEHSLERLTEAFDIVIKPVRRTPFGSEALGLRGFSDCNAGVQWNAWIGTHPGLGDENAAYLGVNLEGLKYGGYPIADLLLQETRSPRLFDAIAQLDHPGRVRVVWWIDAWQGGGRLPNFPEHQVTPEIPLDELTKTEWDHATRTALACLDESRDYRGRGRRVITLRSRERREYAVSPHVQFRTILWTSVPSLDGAIAVMRDAQTSDFGTLASDYGNTYGPIPPATAASTGDRAMTDMDDALALDSLKTLKATDNSANLTLQAASQLESGASQAAPGSAPFLTATAVVASIQSQAVTQRMLAAELRQEAARLAHKNAERKQLANYPSQFGSQILNLLNQQ